MSTLYRERDLISDGNLAAIPATVQILTDERLVKRLMLAKARS